ncbi:MAG TPA: DUF4173 domain-containing protein [Longimicrobium sp.]|nr:DUF4173 domain-containing protein [Longimicrobium sp.]
MSETVITPHGVASRPRPDVPARMGERTRTGLGVAGAAVGLGVAGDVLLRSTPWGLNLTLWTLALVGAAAALRGWADTEEGAVGWMPLAAGVAALTAWRDSPTLKALDLWTLAIILGLAMVGARGGRVRLAGIAHHAVGLLASLADALIGAGALLFRDVRWAEIPARGGTRQVAAALRGVLIALPLLLVFGTLLAAADARFERMLGGLVRVDFASATAHVVFALLFAWLAGGVLRTLVIGGEEHGRELPRPRVLTMGIVEAGTALALLDALFLAFVLVQLPYFFGGADAVRAAGSPSYAEYARRGFFELVTVAGLVLPMLLFADWSVRRERRGHVRAFRLLAGIQVGLLFVIMGSALHRMRLYQQAYGLTELRLYTTAFMLWLAVVFGWFAWTVLRGQRERFAWGALVTALQAVALLHVVNPDAAIVRANAARPDAATRFDAAYAASLSADAVPPLLTALPAVPGAARCRAAERLLSRWDASEEDWRSWSLSRARAVRMVERRAAELREMRCGPAEAPPARAVRRNEMSS